MLPKSPWMIRKRDGDPYSVVVGSDESLVCYCDDDVALLICAAPSTL